MAKMLKQVLNISESKENTSPISSTSNPFLKVNSENRGFWAGVIAGTIIMIGILLIVTITAIKLKGK